MRHEERVLLQVRLCVGAAARAASAGGASSDEACYRCGDTASAAGGTRARSAGLINRLKITVG